MQPNKPIADTDQELFIKLQKGEKCDFSFFFPHGWCCQWGWIQYFKNHLSPGIFMQAISKVSSKIVPKIGQNIPDSGGLMVKGSMVTD